MGPYCNFCNNRCFVYLPNETPKHIRKAYGTSTIIATCKAGQVFEKNKVGFCYGEIQAIINPTEENMQQNFIEGKQNSQDDVLDVMERK